LRDKGASSTDNVNETIDKIRTDFQERVKEIELRLAETIGTVDVLRGKGVPGALHVRGTFDSSATYCLNDLVAHRRQLGRKERQPGPNTQRKLAIGRQSGQARSPRRARACRSRRHSAHLHGRHRRQARDGNRNQRRPDPVGEICRRRRPEFHAQADSR
jgi:hypothetical protein